MTTTADLINETKRYLYSGHREPLNKIVNPIDVDDTSLLFTYDTTSAAVGSYLSIGLEILYVWAASGSTYTVERGVLGSTAATHAAGAIVTINPRFADFSIFSALNSDIDDMSSPSNGLYQPVETTLTYNAAIQGYDLNGATNVLNVLRVRHDTPGPQKTWPEIRQWHLKYDQDVADYPSGMTLVLYQGAWPGLSIRVTYSKAFEHLATVTDDVATVAGLSSTMMDIPVLGAAARLSGVREVARNFMEAQPDPRRATEVNTNAQVAGSNQLTRLRLQRIKDEAVRLQNQYPIRRVNV